MKIKLENLNRTEKNSLEIFAVKKKCFKSWKVYPNHYNGSGRFTTKSRDYVEDLKQIFDKLNLTIGKHFRVGYAEDRTGHTSRFIEILPAGRRLAIMKIISGEGNE